jgi:hypothetical protein
MQSLASAFMTEFENVFDFSNEDNSFSFLLAPTKFFPLSE